MYNHYIQAHRIKYTQIRAETHVVDHMMLSLARRKPGLSGCDTQTTVNDATVQGHETRRDVILRGQHMKAFCHKGAKRSDKLGNA